MKSVKKFVVWLLSAVITGAICGICGVIFSKSVGFVTELRAHNPWILYLLPLAGVLSVVIYKLLKVKNIGAVNVFNSARSEEDLPKGLAPAVLAGTVLSHFFGASVGREGAALQIGGGVANVIGRVFKFDETLRRVSIMCGMAALFSAVFGTPLAACAFIIEVVMTDLSLMAIVPILASSYAAYFVATNLGIAPERFAVGVMPSFNLDVALKTVLITAACIIVGYIFCKGLSIFKDAAKKAFKNEYIRMAVGGIITIILTLIVANYEYNGSGIEIIAHTFEAGTVRYEAFALKILFTVICVAAGYKGGEIIPTLFIGATLGATVASLVGIPLGFGAAVGMAVLFCAATKCPVATVLLACEMFGFEHWIYLAPIVLVTFFIARYKGLYNNPRNVFVLIKEHTNKKA